METAGRVTVEELERRLEGLRHAEANSLEARLARLKGGRGQGRGGGMGLPVASCEGGRQLQAGVGSATMEAYYPSHTAGALC